MALDALDRFLNRAAGLAGVHVEPLALQQDFMDLSARFAHLPGTVVLMSGGDLDCARYHLLGVLPWLVLSSKGRNVSVTIDDQSERIESDPFRVLGSIHQHFGLPAGETVDLPLAAGLMGYLAYDLKDRLEKLPRTSVDELGLPDMLMYAPRLLVVYDRQAASARLVVPLRAGSPARSASDLVRRFHAMAAAPVEAPATFSTDGGRIQSNFTREAYEAAVRRVIDYIAAGDVYQVNLSQRFRVPFSGNGFALFRHLFDLNPAPFFAFVQGGDHQVVSTSPERFLLQNGNVVEARPIKGTRPRGGTVEADRRMREALAGSSKDGAELSMIVDLLRNDIGKVCSPGSVRVVEHKRLEAYQNVYHLVSVIAGELDHGKNAVDLIAATFPGGSITGCPKVRSMEIIDELESVRRHVYCGSIGYIGFHGTMDLSIAIRTATIVDDTLFFSVGGGVVYESRPGDEYEETLHKGRTLMAACGQEAVGIRPSEAMVWQNGCLRPVQEAAIPVTDQGLLYGYGFFETMRVDKGRAPLIDDHVERFSTTWSDLMPGPLPDLTWEEVIARVVAANGLQEQCAAVKILVTRGTRTRPPWDHGLIVSARPYVHRLQASGCAGLSLETYPQPRQTPLASYKTLNYLYYLKAGQWAGSNGCHEALILNPDGSVSETNTASLLIINAREVILPRSPASLPGVMAKAVCRQLEAWGHRIVCRPVYPDELLSAHQVLVTNALMGAVPVIAVDRRPRPAGGDLWIRLNDTVIPQWRESLQGATFPHR